MYKRKLKLSSLSLFLFVLPPRRLAHLGHNARHLLTDADFVGGFSFCPPNVHRFEEEEEEAEADSLEDQEPRPRDPITSPIMSSGKGEETFSYSQ